MRSEPQRTSGTCDAMTDEDRARRVLPPCSCEGGFKERGLVAPDCVWCNWGEDVADALAAVRADERERCARLVEGWHIKRGGYLNLATAIRAGTP